MLTFVWCHAHYHGLDAFECIVVDIDILYRIRSVVEKPIKFIGTGESLEGIDVFYPERMADRILGMGKVFDVAHLLDLLNLFQKIGEGELILAKLTGNLR